MLVLFDNSRLTDGRHPGENPNGRPRGGSRSLDAAQLPTNAHLASAAVFRADEARSH
jgi:hypothetical protein